MYLETRHTRQRTLRGADVRWIVRECTNAIAYGSRNRREDVSSQLHTIAGVTRKAHGNVAQLFYFQIFCHNVVFYGFNQGFLGALPQTSNDDDKGCRRILSLSPSPISVSLLAIIYDYHAFCRGLLHKNAEKRA
jgi:hypothetical protein